MIRKEMNMTQAQALELLKQYNCQPFHLQHAYTLQGVMRYFAKELGYGEQEEFWGLVGLLNFDLVAFIFGSQQNMFARIVYVVIGLSALLAAPLLFAPRSDSNMKSGGM